MTNRLGGLALNKVPGEDVSTLTLEVSGLIQHHRSSTVLQDREADHRLGQAVIARTAVAISRSAGRFVSLSSLFVITIDFDREAA